MPTTAVAHVPAHSGPTSLGGEWTWVLPKLSEGLVFTTAATAALIDSISLKFASVSVFSFDCLFLRDVIKILKS